MTKRERCGGRGKIRYPTKGEAREALKFYHRVGGSHRVERDPCWSCQGWHLTKGLRRK